MAGTIAVSDGDLWSAAGWLFDGVVRFLAQETTDPGVAADLDEIVRENLGWLDIQELPEHARALQKLANELVVDADARMPPTVPEQQHVLDYLGELAELSRRVIGETGGMSTRQA